MHVRSHARRAGRRTVPALGLAAIMVLTTQLAVVAPAGAALAGLTRVTSTGPSNSDWKTRQANCPTDTLLVAGGGRVNGATGQVVMDTMLPVLGATDGYSVTGREDDAPGFTGDWSITATALCAREPAGWELAESTTPWSSASKALTVFCPLGKQLLGVGLEINGGLGQVVVDEVRPSADLSQVTLTAIEDGTGYADEWQIRGKVICVSPLAGLARVAGIGVLDSNPVKSATATCPAGKLVHGVGGEIDGGAGQVRLTGLEPISDTQVRVTAAEDEDGFTGNWAPRAYAICA
ncbi:hypothetical protein [Micromonospora cathayae]|uniref:Neocarzinostatin family protein n=1 Tax=Micromonospora cathayae TaxID=3028804 RepID=A0ABY7ZL72_9ACTN|nr:hypothetical protein [Micromonospora sp. HUAS 3]WDZ83627.1 hypothetical protein PVK37_24650 [Micromonospora sp. HUAS 3]